MKPFVQHWRYLQHQILYQASAWFLRKGWKPSTAKAAFILEKSGSSVPNRVTAVSKLTIGMLGVILRYRNCSTLGFKDQLMLWDHLLREWWNCNSVGQRTRRTQGHHWGYLSAEVNQTLFYHQQTYSTTTTKSRMRRNWSYWHDHTLVRSSYTSKINDERTARDISQAQSILCSDMTMMKIYHPMTVQYPSEPCTYTMEVSYPINCSW